MTPATITIVDDRPVKFNECDYEIIRIFDNNSEIQK